jgi:hypothetical protein
MADLYQSFPICQKCIAVAERDAAPDVWLATHLQAVQAIQERRACDERESTCER